MEALTVGEKIKKLRTTKKLKLKDLANSDLSISKLSFIENNKATPTHKELKYLAKKLDTDISFLNKSIKEELREKFSDLNVYNTNIQSLNKFSETALLNKEDDLAYKSLVYTIIKLILTSSHDEVNIVLSKMYSLITNNYSKEKMIRYFLNIGFYLTNIGEEKIALRYFKILDEYYDDEVTEPNMRFKYNLCLLRCYLNVGEVNNAYNHAKFILDNLNDEKDNLLKGEGIFFLYAFNLVENKLNLEYDLIDAEEYLVQFQSRISSNYIFLSDISFSLGNKKDAIVYLHKAQALLDKTSLHQYLTLIREIIKKFLSRNLYQEADKIIDIYVNKALASGIKKDVEQSYYYKGLILSKKGNTEMADMYFNVSLDVLEKLDEKKLLLSRYNDIGIFYYKNKEYKNAIKYLALSRKIKDII